MTRVKISAELFRWASERSGLSPEVLEESFPKLREWESEELLPTLRQIESFARKTRTPLGYLFLSKPPEEHLPIPLFRTVSTRQVNRPSPDLLETVQTMQQRQDWMREHLTEENEDPLAFVGSVKVEDDPIVIAATIRSALGLGRDWAARHQTWEDALRAFLHSIESTGVIVVANGVVGNNTFRKLDVTEFRGFVLTDDYAPLIFVNAADGKAAQMFTLAHEVAHVWFGHSAAFDLRELQPSNDIVEQACNKVAAEILIPATELRATWNSIRDSNKRFQLVARQFKVSSLVAARRTLDLSLISKSEFLEFYRKYLSSEFTKRKSDGGDFYATQNLRIGRRFAGAVVRAAKEGKLLYNEAYKLTGLHGKTYTQFAKTLLDRPAA